jgi:sucrose-6F-phosphate phosphohydrolase
MTKGRSPDAVRLFVSDLDGTLLPLAGGDGAQRFAAWWDSLSSATRPLLCYNSGRLCGDVHAVVRAAGLPAPDYVIGGVGTSLTDAAGRQLPRFLERFAAGWERSRVQAVMGGVDGIEPQPDRFQSPYKSSWFLLDADAARIDAITAALASAGLRVRMIYSSDRDLDVLPADAGKGHAVEWLRRKTHVAARNIVVAGDTENDLAMFELPDVRGIAVANARPRLLAGLTSCDVYRAAAPAADGVIEGLEYFGLRPAEAKPTELKRRP